MLCRYSSTLSHNHQRTLQLRGGPILPGGLPLLAGGGGREGGSEGGKEGGSKEGRKEGRKDRGGRLGERCSYCQSDRSILHCDPTHIPGYN